MEETLEDHEEVTEPGVEMGEGHERPKEDGGWGNGVRQRLPARTLPCTLRM